MSSLIPSVHVRLLQELRNALLPDGSIAVWISPDPAFQQDRRICRSPFFLALTLRALSACNDLALLPVRHALRQALQHEVHGVQSANYWMRTEPLRVSRPYPDDLDTTACVWIALYPHDTVDERARRLGACVRTLTSVETQPGGPYRTWLVPDDASDGWKDTDVAVNANIAAYLSLHGIQLPPLDAWLAERIRSGALSSPYYPTAFPLWYFLSYCVTGEARELLIAQILDARTAAHGWGDPLSQALALSALARLNAVPDIRVEEQDRLAKQLKSIPLSPGIFCIDSIVSGRPYGAGAPALLVALCLEALTPISPSVPISVSRNEQTELQTILRIVTDRMAAFPESIRVRGVFWREQIVSTSSGTEIPLLAHRFFRALASTTVSIETAFLLGAANVFGWIAYTIYDNVMDEAKDIVDLPVANACLRTCMSLLDEVAGDRSDCRTLVHEVFNGIDAANAWEMQHVQWGPLPETVPVADVARVLPDYGDRSQLAARSFGHALGPLCILMLAGHARDSEAMRALELFFRHAVIARQLDDDAHDWQEDLRAGRITAVVAALLRAWQDQGGMIERIAQTDLPALQQLFWNRIAIQITEWMFAHVRQAEIHLARVPLRDYAALSALLARPRASAEKARAGIQGTSVFLSTYRPSRDDSFFTSS